MQLLKEPYYRPIFERVRKRTAAYASAEHCNFFKGKMLYAPVMGIRRGFMASALGKKRFNTPSFNDAVI